MAAINKAEDILQEQLGRFQFVPIQVGSKVLKQPTIKDRAKKVHLAQA